MAADDIATQLQGIQEQRAQLLWQLLKEGLPKSLMAGAAIGAGAGGLKGLYNLARRNVSPPPRTVYSPVSPLVSDIPYPEDADEHKKAAAKRAAAEPYGSWLDLPADIAQSGIDYTKRLFGGHYADSLMSHPLGLPTLLGGGMVGGIGGYQLMNYLMKRQNKKSREDELSQAREEYEQALLAQQSDKKAGEKTSAARLGEELDCLYDNWEKQSLSKELGTALGAYLLLGGLGAGVTGQAVYNYMAKRQPAHVLAKAQRQHAREMAAQRPVPILARPVPVSSDGTVLPGAGSSEVEDDSEE